MKTYLKKNKALFILPFVLLPFVLLLFYILEGGEQAGKEHDTKNANAEGANYILPEAERTIEIFDKMEAYQQQDLANTRKDYSFPGEEDSMIRGTQEVQLAGSDSLLALLKRNKNMDVSGHLLAHIQQKEEQIRKDLDPESSPEVISGQSILKKQEAKKRKAPVTDEKPEKRLESIPENQSTGIEELEQIFDENLTLNQENDSLKFYLQQTQSQLSDLNQKRQMSFILEKKQHCDFNGKRTSGSLIKAEVYETTRVLNGNRIKMRLLEDAWIGGRKAKRNSFFYGICKISNERLNIQVSQFPLEDSFLPVELQIHDVDGLPGLYVPDNAARRVSKEIGSSTNTSTLWGMSNNPLTNIGISTADRTAQSLLKRVRLKKVTIRKNTLVYLINQNQQP